MDGRTHTRFAVQLPVSFKMGEFSHEGTIVNVSAEGCAIMSETVAEAAAYLQLTMLLKEGEEPVQIDLAAVRWSSVTRFGVVFIKILPEEGERLRTFIKAMESAT